MTNNNPNREAAHNERKPASDQPTAQRKPSEAPGLITRSTYSAEPSRRAAPERRTTRQGRPSGRAPGTAIGGCHACAAVGQARERRGPSTASQAMRRGPFGDARRLTPQRRKTRRGPGPETQRGPQGATSPAGLSRRAVRASGAATPPLRAKRKAPSASATPCPPAAFRCSTLGEGGLNCRVRDGTG